MVEGALRILSICESYPPRYGGGAALYVRDVCQSLAARGHDVSVLTGEEDSRPEYEVRETSDGPVRILCYCIPAFARLDPEGWQLGLVRFCSHQARSSELLAHVLRETRPNIVLYSATRPLGEAALLALRKSGIPTLGMLHEGWLICGRVMLLRSPTSQPCSGPGVSRCLECLYSHYDGGHGVAVSKLLWRIPKLGLAPAFRLFQRWRGRRGLRGALAYSRFMAQVHAAHVPGEVRYVNLGINLAGQSRNRPLRPRSPLRFGFMAGFQPTKGALQLLDAARGLKAEGLPFVLYIWGPELPSAQREISARGLEDRVHCRGMFKPDSMWDVYAEIDVAVMATLVVEPFGRIPQEAAAAGVPSIVPAIGGLIEQIRHGHDGLLYRFRDTSDLQRSMRTVLTEPGLFQRLASNLWSVVDTRSTAADLELFCRETVAISQTHGDRRGRRRWILR